MNSSDRWRNLATLLPWVAAFPVAGALTRFFVMKFQLNLSFGQSVELATMSSPWALTGAGIPALIFAPLTAAYFGLAQQSGSVAGMWIAARHEDSQSGPSGKTVFLWALAALLALVITTTFVILLYVKIELYSIFVIAGILAAVVRLIATFTTSNGDFSADVFVFVRALIFVIATSALVVGCFPSAFAVHSAEINIERNGSDQTLSRRVVLGASDGTIALANCPGSPAQVTYIRNNTAVYEKDVRQLVR